VLTKKASRSTTRKSAKSTTSKTTRKAARKTATQTAKKAKRTRRKLKSPLGKVELKKFREVLLAKRRDLIGDMNGIEAEALRINRKDAAGDLSNLPTHPADIGTDNYEQEFTLGLLESEHELLDEINLALERIEQGTYGICLGTGKPIGKARLKARPWAKYCIEYAHCLEKGLVSRDEDRENEIAEGFSESDENFEDDIKVSDDGSEQDEVDYDDLDEE